MNRAIFVLTICIVSCAAWAGDLVAVDKPEWRVGDTWSFERTDYPHFEYANTTRSRYTLVVTGVEPTFYRVDYSENSDGTTSAPAHWRFSPAINFMGFIREKSTWQEFLWFKWPLKIGATWDASWFTPNAGDSVSRISVKGWEDVEVPAGRFRGLRVDIEWKGFAIHEVAHNTRSVWYVPGVKRLVRFEEWVYASGYMIRHRIDELASYSIHSGK